MVAALLLSLLSGPAHAGSISTAGVTAGPDGGAATANVAAIAYNPGALAAVDGFQAMIDGQASFVRIETTTTRNGGIDPNTGQAYLPAQATAVVPNGLVGLSYQVIPDRLTVGFAAYDPFVGGGDYSGSEKGTVPPYTGHQRYHIIDTAIITLALEPAVAVTIVDGLHVGAGAGWMIDTISVKQASDPLGTEGILASELDQSPPDHPYALDTLLQGKASGGHFIWNAGVFVDKWRYLKVGASFSAPGRFTSKGDGSVTVPEDLSTVAGGVTVPAKVSVEFPLPAIARLYVDSQITDKVNIGAGVDYQMWNLCCGEQDGDITIGLTNEAGGAIGPDDGVTIEIDTVQYSPRRLWNSMNISQLGGVQVNDDLWTGWRLMYNQNAVPDYAVSPSNLDFQNVGFSLGSRYRFAEKFTVGLSYTKYFLFTRTITDSAWDRRDGNERFSPELPYKASTNGTYSGNVDTVGLRLGLKL
ncbi:MAG: outer membrane protein transport protein [Alphaproteobacteria bacterium]|nr:outer membrane protein transport protein [Alphaproteobacteria bacterium]